MWPYWLLFLIPAYFALREPRPAPPGAPQRRRFSDTPHWWWLAVALALMIGLRHQVGGDWGNYLVNFEATATLPLQAVLQGKDPGYRLLEWLAHQAGWGVYGVNLMGGALFSAGLLWFCRHLPRPWLGLVVAVPYLVIVLGMGYTRQGVALGCIMAGLVALGQGRRLPFVLWALLGATFHKSAVLVLPMAALAAAQGKWWATLWVGVVVAGAYQALLEDSVASLVENYIDARYQSQGALVRLLMNALPAAVLLLSRKRFALTLPQQKLWFWYSVFSIAALIAYYYLPSSTAVDRVALYLLPLQLVVFAYLPEVAGRSTTHNKDWALFVVLYYALVQFVWLNYANFAYTWIPYRFYPLVDQL
jgi:hypothetical protein